jgi:hypothetical protein
MILKKIQRLKHYINYYFFKIYTTMTAINKKCLNVGCGNDIRLGWINYDAFPINDKVIKFDILSTADLSELAKKKYDIIECNHVIGYINYICAVNFFKAAYSSLNVGGKLIIEFPDAIKLSKKLSGIQDFSNMDEYIEVIRGIYAYDSNDPFDKNFSKKTYIFGWSVPIVNKALNDAGFICLKSMNPKTHGQLIWRDSRVEACKL